MSTLTKDPLLAVARLFLFHYRRSRHRGALVRRPRRGGHAALQYGLAAGYLRPDMSDDRAGSLLVLAVASSACWDLAWWFTLVCSPDRQQRWRRRSVHPGNAKRLSRMGWVAIIGHVGRRTDGIAFVWVASNRRGCWTNSRY